MNENLNLVEILKNVPIGTKLYSPIFGEVELVDVSTYINDKYPIVVCYSNDTTRLSFMRDGRYYQRTPNGECLLFPSKDQRDWSKFKPKKPKFDPKTLKPFDKVLAKLSDDSCFVWFADYVSIPVGKMSEVPCIVSNKECDFIIPYNEDTKHLVGTTEDAPEFYRYWED